MAQSSPEAKARYRERNREKIRVAGRAYQLKRNRAAGLFERGSPESRARLSAVRKPRGAEHGNWKGDEASYTAIHTWLRRWKPRTGVCEKCGKRPQPRSRLSVGTQFANISGSYKRDVTDYLELCPSCHRKRDITPETRAKIAAAHRGKTHSAEHRAKVSAGMKASWARRRAA